MKTPTIQDQCKTVLRTSQTYMQLRYVANNFNYSSAWSGIQKKIPTLYSTAFHQIVAGTPSLAGFMTQASIQGVTLGINNRSEFDNMSKSTISELGTINRTSTIDSQGQLQTKQSGRDQLPEWQQRMIDKNEAAKKEVAGIMDDSLRSVMAKIEKKPEGQRDSAADSYTSAVDWIMSAVKGVINRVR